MAAALDSEWIPSQWHSVLLTATPPLGPGPTAAPASAAGHVLRQVPADRRLRLLLCAGNAGIFVAAQGPRKGHAAP